jgi:hypothetical protein
LRGNLKSLELKFELGKISRGILCCKFCQRTFYTEKLFGKILNGKVPKSLGREIIAEKFSNKKP